MSDDTRTPLSAPLDDFKPREIEILTLMAAGLSNTEIAEQLFISSQTVRWYNKQIYSKLGTSRRTEAIARARQFGLIATDQADPPPTMDKPPSAAAIHHAPLPVTYGPFIGRDDDMAQVIRLLQNPAVRLLTLVATGGMGKSRLALEVAHALHDQYTQGAVFIDLTPVRKADDIAQVALNSLGMASTNPPDAKTTLLNYCANKSLLLVFDNMEHLMDGVALLVELSRVAPQVTMLVTSRQRLTLRLETVYYLQPIDQDAARLFMEVATMMRPHLNDTSPTPDDVQAVERIVQQVGGLPLALILAAAWVDTLTLPEIAQEITRSLDFLSVELADMPPRQRSIRAVIDPTWQRLAPDEQRVFMQLSVFRGGFTREMFQQVTGASIRTLQTLLGRSLITTHAQQRYDMHPLLRQYARDKLVASGDYEATRRAHLQVCMDYARAQVAILYDGDYLAVLDRLQAEHDNVQSAFDWVVSLSHPAADDVHMAAQLATAMAQFWDVRSHGAQAQAIITALLQHHIQQPMPPALQADLTRWRGRFQYRLGHMDAARADDEAAIALCESLLAASPPPDADQTRYLQAVLARTWNYLSYLPAPLDVQRAAAERALQISQALVDSPQATAHDANTHAISLGSIGFIVHEAGDHTQALAYLQQAYDIFESLGNLQGVSMVAYNMGIIYKSLQQTERTRQLYEQSLAIKYRIGDQAGIARRLAVLAEYEIITENFEQAQAYLHESRLICEQLGERQRLAYTLGIQGLLAYIMTDFAGAQRWLEQGLSMAQPLNMPQRIHDYHHLLVLVHLQQNNVSQAHASISYMQQHADEVSDAHHQWMHLCLYAHWLITTGDDALATCVRITAVLEHHRNIAGLLKQRYIHDPHVYRLKQRIGAAAWQQAQDETQAISLAQLFATIREGGIA